VNSLAKHNLHFEVCIKGDAQFDSACVLIEEKTGKDLLFVLNHVGKPDIVGKDEDQPNWRQYMERLSKSSNVVCKLSGRC